MLTILPDPAHLRLDCVRVDADTLTLVMASKGDQARCPLCTQHSDQRHSCYVRTLADLPWNGVTVRLQLTVRVKEAAFAMAHSARRGLPSNFCLAGKLGPEEVLVIEGHGQ